MGARSRTAMIAICYCFPYCFAGTRHCSGVHAICRSSGCTCGLWKACGCNGLWPLVPMADRGASLIPHEDSCLYRQRGIAKLILNGYRDRLFLLFLLLFVPSSDISLGIAMASMDWARPSISADLGAILSLLGSPDAHSRPSSGPCDANHLHSQLMKN